MPAGRRIHRRLSLILFVVVALVPLAHAGVAQADNTTADCPSTQGDYPNHPSYVRAYGTLELGWNVVGEGNNPDVGPCWRAHPRDDSGDARCVEQIHDWGTHDHGPGLSTHYDSRVIIDCHEGVWEHTKLLEREDEQGFPFQDNWEYIFQMKFFADCPRGGAPFGGTNHRNENACHIAFSIGQDGPAHLKAIAEDWTDPNKIYTDFWVFGSAGSLHIYDEGVEQ